jgi:integrase
MAKKTDKKGQKDMYASNKRTTGKGNVGLESYRGRLRLSLPRQWYGGKQKYLSLGLSDTPENRAIANQRIAEIERDWKLDNFDPTLERYKNGERGKANLSVIESIQKTIWISDIWDKYQEYKKDSRKQATLEQIRYLTQHIHKLGKIEITDTLGVIEGLKKITTNHQTKRCLIELNAVCKWAIKHRLITSISVSPYEGLANELPRYNYQSNPKPNAFSESQMNEVINAFKSHHGNNNGKVITGYAHKHYASFVEFLFLTGCRTSEAIGLQWKQISSDCGEICFDGSLQYLRNEWVRSQGSKNNKNRIFPCSERLRNLLLKHRPAWFDEANCADALVFPAPKGGAINRGNFSNGVWKKIVDPIKAGTTPYSCRDTFITLQILKGVPEGVIAKWTDTSIEMIQKHYADYLHLRAIRPID